MPNLQKLLRAMEQLDIDQLDYLRDYIEHRRQELLGIGEQPAEIEVDGGIDALCASIKRDRSGMSKEQMTEIKWTTSMLYLKDESNSFFE
jgi:hypothetical protein